VLKPIYLQNTEYVRTTLKGQISSAENDLHNKVSQLVTVFDICVINRHKLRSVSVFLQTPLGHFSRSI
jgi:hypothetical protein